MFDTMKTVADRPSRNGVLARLKSAWCSIMSAHRETSSLVLHEFAQSLEESREPAEVQVAFLRRVYELSGAVKAELWIEREGRPQYVSCWPEPRTGESARVTKGSSVSDADWIRLPIRGGGQAQGTLRLLSSPGQVWSGQTLRDLTTMAVMATSAERALRNDRLAEAETTHDVISGLHNNTFLQAFLNYTVHQAQRRHESVSLLYLGIDRLGAIESLHGPEVTIQAMRCVARATLSTLRSGDVVGRLNDGRLVAVLPNVASADSLIVAEALCAAIAEAGKATIEMPVLTASLGVATYPDHAHDAASLRAAAAAALLRAQALGRNQVLGTSAVNPRSTLSVMNAAG